MKRMLTGLALIIAAGCSQPTAKNMPVQIGVPREKVGCIASYDRKQMLFICDGIRYDLFQKPLREERTYDLISGETKTTRFYEAKNGRSTYMYVTEQADGSTYPSQIRIEAPKGSIMIKLNCNGELSTVITERKEY